MFIDGCYGGDTGIIYVDGVYGNYKPEVPKISIQKPTIFHSYIFNFELPQIVRGIPGIQKAAPRIIGPIDITVSAENTEKIEFYVDDELKITDEQSPFEWKSSLPKGLHTVETIAYDAEGDISKDIVDVFVIL